MAHPHDSTPVALVVEEDDETRHLASAVLEETDLDVIACSSAEAAISALEHRNVTVALLFADMGQSSPADGAALARTVEKRWPNARMVMTSAGTREQGGRSGLPAQAVYMPKPWRAFDVLVQAERATLRSS